jgi:hypothetical protein
MPAMPVGCFPVRGGLVVDGLGVGELALGVVVEHFDLERAGVAGEEAEVR